MISSLKIRNFRLYFFGQLISNSGTFLQAVALSWLVLTLTNSGTMVGLVLFFQFFPKLLINFLGGVVADRFSKLKIIYITSAVPSLLALALGILILANLIQVWMVFLFALLLGINGGFEVPARQAFAQEMVGKDLLENALGLWSILTGLSRIVGPAIAGIVIAKFGIGYCFILNAISYVFIIIALSMMREAEFYTMPAAKKSSLQIRETFRHIRKTPVLIDTIIMVIIIGTITFEWEVSLPLVAKFSLRGSAETYSLVAVFMSLGMLVGGFFNAGLKKATEKKLIYSALFLGIFTLISALAKNLNLLLGMMFFLGVFAIFFQSLSQRLLQVNSNPAMRGKVMSFWTMGLTSSTAIGGPLIGSIGQYFGAQWTLIVGGIVPIAIAGFFILKIYFSFTAKNPQTSYQENN